MAAGWTSERLRTDPIWVLSLTWGGRDYRFSSVQGAVSEADGAEHVLYGELQLNDFEREADLFSLDPAAASVPLELFFPDTDIPTLYSYGLDLVGLEAELSILFPGDVWEDRIAQVVGLLGGVRYGSASDPVRCVLEARPDLDDPPILSASARIGSDTWSSPGSGALGAMYPLVWGASPGYAWTDASGAARNTSASPGWLADTDTLLIGLGPVGAAGQSVSVWNDQDGSSEAFTVQADTDALGVSVATLDVSAAATLTVSGADRYFVRWDGGGGQLDLDGSSLDQLGDLVWYLLRRWGGRIDRARLQALIPWLNQISVAGYIDDPEIGAWEWLRANVLDLLPLGAALSPDGLYLIPLFLGAAPEQAVAHLQIDQDLAALDGEAGLIQIGSIDQVVNAVTVNYALRARTGDYLGSLSVVGSEASGNQIESGRARRSSERYGERSATLESAIIYDASSAALIASWTIEARAYPRRTILYWLDPRRSWIQPGAIVLISHPEYGLQSCPAIVLRRGWRGGFPFIEVWLRPA